MKKSFMLFAFLLLVCTLGFTACNNNGESKEKGKNTETVIQYETPLLKTDFYDETTNGIHLIVRYNIEDKYFSGNLENVSDELVKGIKVFVHLSNGMDLGPSPAIDMEPGKEASIVIDADVKEWEKWATELELN